MPGEPFDAFARALGETKSRRQMLRVAAGGVLGGVAAALGFRAPADASSLCNPQVTPCRQLYHGVCTPCNDIPGKLCDDSSEPTRGQCVYSCQGCTHQSGASCVDGCGVSFCCDTGERICRPVNQRCQVANASGACTTCKDCNPDGTCPQPCTGCTHFDSASGLCLPGCTTGNCCSGNTCIPTPKCSTSDSNGQCITCAQAKTCCKSDGTCAAAGGCQGADANGNCAPCNSLPTPNDPQVKLCCDTAHGSVCVVPGQTCACDTCANNTCQACGTTVTSAPVCCFNPSNAGGICILVSQQPNGGTCVTAADGSCGCATGCCNAGTCVSSASQCPAPGCHFATGDGRCQCGCPSGQVCSTSGTPTCVACGAANQPCCAGSTCNSGNLTCQGGICKQLTCLNALCGGTNNSCGSSSVPNQCDPCANNGTVSCYCSNLTSNTATCVAAKPVGATCAASGNQTADGQCQGAWTVAGSGTCSPTGAACTSDSQCCTFCNPTTGQCTPGYCNNGGSGVGQCNHACGGAGQQCCVVTPGVAGTFCISGLSCQNDFCSSTTCGNANQPCCGGFTTNQPGACFTGATCQSGTCVAV